MPTDKIYCGYVLHKGKHGYIKTDKKVWGKGINPKTREIRDPFVIQQVSISVVDYMEKLNKRNISNWTLDDVMAWRQSGEKAIYLLMVFFIMLFGFNGVTSSRSRESTM